MDLGSSGPVLIPGTFGGHNLIAFSSKMGRAYRLSNPGPTRYIPTSSSGKRSRLYWNEIAGFNHFKGRFPKSAYPVTPVTSWGVEANRSVCSVAVY